MLETRLVWTYWARAVAVANVAATSAVMSGRRDRGRVAMWYFMARLPGEWVRAPVGVIGAARVVASRAPMRRGDAGSRIPCGEVCSPVAIRECARDEYASRRYEVGNESRRA